MVMFFFVIYLLSFFSLCSFPIITSETYASPQPFSSTKPYLPFFHSNFYFIKLIPRPKSFIFVGNLFPGLLLYSNRTKQFLSSKSNLPPIKMPYHCHTPPQSLYYNPLSFLWIRKLPTESVPPKYVYIVSCISSTS